MKDYLKEQIKGVDDNNLARCIVREYLQARILQMLQDNGAFVNWAFVGGTALRFLYSMPRFSEDLDFSLTKPGIEDDFVERMKNAERAFRAEDYDVEIRTRVIKTVKSAFIKLQGLPYEMGISPHRNETISIKVEVDTNPPSGANFKTSVIRKHLILNIQHYDKADLFAGKLAAILTRLYCKGRDIYDLLWYLSDRAWPAPNILLLCNSLKQTGWRGPVVTPDNWKYVIRDRLKSFDWSSIVRDVGPFLERPADIKLLTKENLLSFFG